MVSYFDLHIAKSMAGQKYIDATMKVSIEVLQRVYANLQDQDDENEIHKDGLNPENHLFFVNAYEMPRWHWSNERGAFERCVCVH